MKINAILVFKLKMNCSRGTYTRGELLALWSLLFFARFKQFSHIQVAGDSKIVIDSLFGKCDLQVASLEGWQSKIGDILSEFTQIEAQHVYREYNSSTCVYSFIKARFIFGGRKNIY